MAQPNHTPRLAHTEVALTVIFCVVDDAYTLLNPRARRYESLNRLAGLGDHRACTLPAAEGCGERTLVLAGRREVLLSAVPWGSGALHPSSFHRRVSKLRRFLEPLRREVLSEMVGDPQALLVDSRLLSVLHPRQVSQGSGFPGAAWVRWGSFSVYGVKLHLLCATNRVPISYELTPANVVADISLTEELINEAKLEEGVTRRLLGDLAYRSEDLREALSEVDIPFWQPSALSGVPESGSK